MRLEPPATAVNDSEHGIVVVTANVQFAVHVLTKRTDLHRRLQQLRVAGHPPVFVFQSPDATAVVVAVDVPADECRETFAPIDVAADDRETNVVSVLLDRIDQRLAERFAGESMQAFPDAPAVVLA